MRNLFFCFLALAPSFIASAGVSLRASNPCDKVDATKTVEFGDSSIQCQNRKKNGWSKIESTGRPTVEEQFYENDIQRKLLIKDRASGKLQAYGEYSPSGEIIYWLSETTVQGVPPADLPADAKALQLKAGQIPPAEIAKASRYIAGQVGESYFQTQFQYDPSASAFDKSSAGAHYRMAFKYQPLHRLAPEAELAIETYSTHDKVTGFVVKKDSAGKIVEPSITREAALKIAKKALPPGEISLLVQQPNWLVKTNNWTWQVTSGPSIKSDCYTSSKANIDMSDGTISNTSSGTVCR